MCVHALHTVHALPDLRVAAGRLRDGVSINLTRSYRGFRVLNLMIRLDRTFHDGGRLKKLSLLPFSDFLQRLFDCAALLVFEFRIASQPLIECFFRPEEVNDSSTTTHEEDSRSRFLGFQFASVED